MYKAIFFDHDDTLVATREPKWAHHKYVAKTYYGKDLTDEDILPHWGKPLPQLVGLLYGTDNIEEALAFNTLCHEQFPKILYKETIPTLRALTSRGIRLGVVTATTRFSFEHDLQLHQIPKETFHYTQTAEDTRFHKPDFRVFEPALQWLSDQNIKPHEVLYIADGMHDMTAAVGAGFHFIGVETGLTTREQFEKAGVTVIPTIAPLVYLYNEESTRI